MAQADRSGSAAGESRSAISISVFFPCYNEQANVAKVAEQAVGVLEGLGADYEILIVDDGSADGTGRIADEIAAGNDRIRVIHHERKDRKSTRLNSSHT